VIGVVVISALLALGVLVWLPFQGQDAQYIEQCLAEWGTAHSGSFPTTTISQWLGLTLLRAAQTGIRT
jgi:hypothetical protein